MADPYLTPAQVRERISRGSTPLKDDEFDDEAVADLVAEFEEMVEKYRGVAFTPRVQVETVRASAPGGSDRLLLNWPQVREITSFLVDGAEVVTDLYSFDLSGRVYYPSGFHPRYPATITYGHGFDETPVCLLRACAMYVEWQAQLDRSSGSRDLAREVFALDGGVGSNVFIQPDPANGRLTGKVEIDRLINMAPDFRTPGIA